MGKRVKKITLVIGGIIILPMLVFFVYQFNTMNESEKVIEQIYTNQLSYILNSVNQHSEFVVSGWASRIELMYARRDIDEEGFEEAMNDFLMLTSSVRGVIVADTSSLSELTVYSPNNNLDFNDFKNFAADYWQNNRSMINRLLRYKDADYGKIENKPEDAYENDPLYVSTDILTFILELPNGGKKVCGIVVTPQEFVEQVLGPHIQRVTEGKFSCAVYMNDTENVIYSTEDVPVSAFRQSQQMWLFNYFSVGILLKGRTIEGLVKERFYTNLIIVSVLILVLLVGMFIVFNNIRKEIELAQIKSDFVSNVSHELRTPLALISMFAETLEMDRVKTEEKKKNYYSIISQEANRLGRIVNTILNFSKMEAGKRTYHFEKANLNDVVKRVMTTYEFHLENKGFTHKIELADELRELMLDTESVSEAFINLLDNAMKYSMERKEIVIRTGMNGRLVYVEVEDKGMGISPDQQKKIFDKFYRVTTGAVHNTKGTGLGLTLVQRIMDEHNGAITLKSELGNGSTFKLIFPVDDQPANKEDK